ncbi:MAG TPA: pantetheine-phosphate adenylyltransferase [Candidatus Acidoferrales bacterium]|nr:pantetheine-phosphate adenylyltransferase [Candidatus Acidoferrales bacterium]
MSRVAVYPGSFDPVSNGHLDVVMAALDLFDLVIVAVLDNPEKRAPLFSAEERVEMLAEALSDQPRAQVRSLRGLTADFAHSQGAVAIVKGLRSGSDFDSELQQAMMNRSLAPSVRTVFLLSQPTHAHLASSILKDVAAHHGDVSGFVPAGAARRLKEKFN